MFLVFIQIGFDHAAQIAETVIILNEKRFNVQLMRTDLRLLFSVSDKR